LKNIDDRSYRRRAFRHLHNALRLARQLGDKKSEGRLYGMLASAVSLFGKKRIAIRLFKTAYDIAEDLGDQLHMAIWTANIGEDLMTVDGDRARRQLLRARDMFLEMEIPAHARYCDSLLQEIML
jgi:hypothetical protein